MKTVWNIAVLCLCIYTVQAQSGKDIMIKNDAQIRTQDESRDLTMILTDAKGRSRERKVNQYSINDAEDNRSTIIRFSAPADVKGTSFLAVEHSTRDDDQWLYLPALRKTRRISSSDITDNFVGSDFTYEDLGTEDLEDFSYTVLREDTFENASCYVIEAIPITPEKIKETGYSKRILYIRKSEYLAVKVDYFDKKGNHTKTFTITDIRKIPNSDKTRAHILTMKNLRTKHTTVLRFNNFKINQGLDTALFSKRNLEK